MKQHQAPKHMRSLPIYRKRNRPVALSNNVILEQHVVRHFRCQHPVEHRRGVCLTGGKEQHPHRSLQARAPRAAHRRSAATGSGVAVRAHAGEHRQAAGGLCPCPLGPAPSPFLLRCRVLSTEQTHPRPLWRKDDS